MILARGWESSEWGFQATLTNSGDFDFALICLGDDNVIYENLGDGSFAQTTLAHAGADSTTGCSWGDFDNDGLLDLHVTNLGRLFLQARTR